jgi:hypothetical protein
MSSLLELEMQKLYCLVGRRNSDFAVENTVGYQTDLVRSFVELNMKSVFMLTLVSSATNAPCSHLRVSIPGGLRFFRRCAIQRAKRAGSESRTPNRFDSGDANSGGVSPV